MTAAEAYAKLSQVWDRTHTLLSFAAVDVVKARQKDPESFEHIQHLEHIRDELEKEVDALAMALDMLRAA